MANTSVYVVIDNDTKFIVFAHTSEKRCMQFVIDVMTERIIDPLETPHTYFITKLAEKGYPTLNIRTM